MRNCLLLLIAVSVGLTVTAREKKYRFYLNGEWINIGKVYIHPDRIERADTLDTTINISTKEGKFEYFTLEYLLNDYYVKKYGPPPHLYFINNGATEYNFATSRFITDADVGGVKFDCMFKNKDIEKGVSLHLYNVHSSRYLPRRFRRMTFFEIRLPYQAPQPELPPGTIPKLRIR